VLLYQDEARFPLVPTLTRTLGIKSHRPVVGTWDNKDVVQVFGAVDAVSGRLISDIHESSASDRRRDGENKTLQMQRAFAAHLNHLGDAYPKEMFPEVILAIDNAPWHRGKVIDAVLAGHTHLKFYRLPSYNPQLNSIERLWKPLRRDVSHNRLFDSMDDLTAALSRRLRRFKRSRCSVLAAIGHAPTKSPAL
jgi:hypothetical protein